MLKAEDIKKVGIGGAGTMGSSMAQIFAECGYDVKIYTRRQETLDKAKASIRSALDT
jgi:3-hydroxybutyryl-CoA dehydrogenase